MPPSRASHKGMVKLFAQSRLSHLQQSPSGAIWAIRQQTNLVRFGADGTWHVEPTPLGDSGGSIHDIFIDSSDTLWVAQGGRLYRRPHNETEYIPTEAQMDFAFGFVETPDHSLWGERLHNDCSEPPHGPDAAC